MSTGPLRPATTTQGRGAIGPGEIGWKAWDGLFGSARIIPSLRPAYFRFFAAARQFLREVAAGRDSLTARHRRQRRGQAISWRLRFGDPGLDRLLHLFESTHLDLPHALTRHVEFSRELLKRNRVVSQPAGLEDAALAGIEHAQRAVQRIHANARFLAVGEQRFLIHGVIDQPVLPLALAALAQGRIEGSVAAETAVHIDHVLLADAEPLRNRLDLIVAQIALVERRNPALGLAQVEEQLLLARRRAHLHERPRAQDVFLDRGANPPHGVSRELESLVRLEALDRLHEADVALGDHLADRQAVAAIAHGDLGDQPKMRGDELVRRLAIPMFAPALGQHEFLLRLQHWEPRDLLQVAGKPRFARNDGK